MATKSKTKSRTNNNSLTKKVAVPRWAIAVVLFIVAATGAFLVYQSFAAPRIPSQNNITYIGTETVYCLNGDCGLTATGGRVSIGKRRIGLTNGDICTRVYYENESRGKYTNKWLCLQ